MISFNIFLYHYDCVYWHSMEKGSWFNSTEMFSPENKASHRGNVWNWQLNWQKAKKQDTCSRSCGMLCYAFPTQQDPRTPNDPGLCFNIEYRANLNTVCQLQFQPMPFKEKAPALGFPKGCGGHGLKVTFDRN